MSEQLALLPAYLTGHLQITLLALLLATIVSVPLGIAATRIAWLERVALTMTSAIQTIPGLALLAVMVPLLAALGLPSIGYLPAIVGLTLYALLPILRNTATGIEGVDPSLIDAARGVGMTPRQQLLRVEIPLAAPVIVAGIRTATVWTVGMATLATPVGAISLGNYIFSGLQTRNLAAVLIGSAASAALALVLDGLVRMVETGVRRRRRPLVAAGGALAALLYGYAALAALPALHRERTIVIGAKPFTEQLVLAEILSVWIGQQTHRSTRILPALGSTVAFDALKAGEVDVYVDYSGTLWTTILRGAELPQRREQLLEQMRARLRSEHGVTLAAALGFENAYVLAIRESEAALRDIARISDLKPLAPTMSMGADYEFFSRPEWRRLQELYGLRFAAQRTMDPSLLYPAAARGDVDVVTAYSSDGRLETARLRVLEDDLAAIPPYDAVILVGGQLAERDPEVLRALAALENGIDVTTMQRMNLAVDANGYSPAQVAGNFVRGWRPRPTPRADLPSEPPGPP
ncbi:MAG TPA: ABC transporter permease/substrate-binding protein [Candidatus Binatia bacterium]|nr:ABC transporter permease/substrate-binding protein [Candidatus Binatia bacterium]